MSQEETRFRWARFNMLGQGKNRSAYGTLWYRGDTLFSAWMPAARVLRNHEGRVAALYNGMASVGRGLETWNGRVKVDGRSWDFSANTPCVGVFSRYEGDCMPAETLHRRCNFLWNAQFKEALVSYQEEKPSDFASNPDFHVEKVVKNLQNIENARLRYSVFFALGWDPIDTEDYRSDIAEFYHTHADVYNMPKNVEKRERAAARRTAKKAFGVE